jgi:predicted RNA-binding protein YlxR (DUF448 family)
MTKVKASSPSIRHVPQRTCIACRTTEAKRELVRLVRLPDGSIKVDLTGKKSGRGAYLCLSKSCWETALNTGRLEHAFRTGLKPEDRKQLENYVQEVENICSRTEGVKGA